MFGLSGIIVFKLSSKRSIGSFVSKIGASSKLFCGKYESSLRINSVPSSSFSTLKCATPDFPACTSAPPRSSVEISSPVTDFTTFGPVTNMYELSSVINTKSVNAGEYTAPPAQGP